MKKLLKSMLLAALVLTFAAASIPQAAAYTPPVSTVKIGLKYSSSAPVCGNLQNVSGFGSGYEFGYYNANREFVSIGATTTETKISVLLDKNMYYSSENNTYYQFTDSGTILVGCFHLQLETAYSTYAEARAAADTFTSVNAFPKYTGNAFYVCAGSYTTRASAENAAAYLNIQQGYTITSGTSYTVAVVKTGTSDILLEYDCGSASSLAVHPLAPSGGKAQTWYSGYKYYGDFQYTRISGGNLTIVNILPVEDYVKGVIPYEMSASWPLEALKAQAVCARTYVMSHLNRHSYYGFDVCNTTDCQVYYGTNRANSNSDRAVEETAGAYLTYNGKLCETYYFSSDGGATESGANVWSSNLGYLIGKADPYEKDVASKISNYNWTVTYTGAELAAKLQKQGARCAEIVKFEITEFTSTGNVLKIRFTDVNGQTFSYSKASARSILGLRSQRYTVSSSRKENDIYVNSSSDTLGNSVTSAYAIGSSGTGLLGSSGDVYAITGDGSVSAIDVYTGEGSGTESVTFTITGSGWGHNVGMSQWGAYSMAQYHNMTYEQILTFYFSNTKVERT